MNRRDQWNKLMRSLPDQAFMEVMNNYLGGVKTPYDKNDLLQRLADSLERPETIRDTLLRIGPADLRLLSAIQWFRRPDRSALIDFFSGSLSPSAVGAGLIGLEERLLIFFDRTGPEPSLVLSPLLPEDILRKLGPSRLIRLQPALPPPPRELPLINGSFLICFFTLLNEDPKICNTDGSIKKRFTSALTRIFPAAGFTDEPNETLHLLLNAFKTLGLLGERSGEWQLKLENLKAFSALERREQLLWVWGALCTKDLSRAESCSRLIAALTDSFPRESALERKDMEALLLLLQEKLMGEERISASHIFRIAARFGLLAPRGELWAIHPVATALLGEERPAEGTLFLQAPYDANLTPETPFSLPLALALRPERYDAFCQLRLTDGAFRRFLKAGFSAEDLEEELSRRYGLALPQNIQFSLREWAEEYRGLQLWEGVVLEVRPDRIPLVMGDGRLKALIRRTFAEGVYLLAKEDRPLWEEAMRDAGIATVPRTNAPGRKGPRPVSYRPDTEPSSPPPLALAEAAEAEGGFPPEELVRQKASLLAFLDGSSDFDEEEKEELRARIQRGVISREEQLRPGILRRELTTVKGLDYQGKLRMIQAVLGNRAYLLEVTLPTEDLDLETYRVLPRRLDQDKEAPVFLTGTEPSGKPFRCPVRKISRLRKIRSALF